MFVCDDCLKLYYTNQAAIVASRGPCEHCRKVASCSDIPSYQLVERNDDKHPAPVSPAWSETPPTEPGDYLILLAPDIRIVETPERALICSRSGGRLVALLLDRDESYMIGGCGGVLVGARWQRIVAPQPLPPQTDEAPTPAKAISAPARDPFGPVTNAEWSAGNTVRVGHVFTGLLSRTEVGNIFAARRAAWLATMPPDVGALVDEGMRLYEAAVAARDRCNAVEAEYVAAGKVFLAADTLEVRVGTSDATRNLMKWLVWEGGSTEARFTNTGALLNLAGSAAADCVRAERAERERDEARENRDAIHAKLTETLERLHRREQREASADPERHLARYRATRAQLRTAQTQIKLLENHAFKREKFHLNIWRGINEAERAAVAKAKSAEQRAERAEAACSLAARALREAAIREADDLPAAAARFRAEAMDHLAPWLPADPDAPGSDAEKALRGSYMLTYAGMMAQVAEARARVERLEALLREALRPLDGDVTDTQFTGWKATDALLDQRREEVLYALAQQSQPPAGPEVAQ